MDRIVVMARKQSRLALTENARVVLETRYLQRDEMGRLKETPEGLFERVAGAVASVEKREKEKWREDFLKLMLSRRFLPNTPTLLNAGKKGGQLSACYVLPVEDSLTGIFDTLKNAAVIHQSGGGTGFSFSRVRQKGATVGSTRGLASGPISFMKIYDSATETIKQGGARRGANMGILKVDHPDILEFINSKSDKQSIANFNISVGITKKFIQNVIFDREYELRDPRTGEKVRTVSAREIFDQLVKAAWECGDPGLVFLDRINQFNPTPRVGEIESTNPCGEQPLLGFESCNLGSLNLGEYWNGEQFEWERLREDIFLAVRFLDNVIDLNDFPVPESLRITRRNRKIGLGVMGFADLLLRMGVKYESDEGLMWGERLMSFLDREAKAASANLALTRGAFPNWKGSMWEKLGYPRLRNSTVSTVAPTGSISIIAGASSGIEPIFSGIFFRNVLSGARLREIHPAVAKALEERGMDPDSVTEDHLGEFLGPSWNPAQKVSVEGHVKMQAAFQRHSDSAVSKTINLPESASPGEVERAYLLAYQLGCKGITVYRDKSRPAQVLEQAVCLVCKE